MRHNVRIGTAPATFTFDLFGQPQTCSRRLASPPPSPMSRSFFFGYAPHRVQFRSTHLRSDGCRPRIFFLFSEDLLRPPPDDRQQPGRSGMERFFSSFFPVHFIAGSQIATGLSFFYGPNLGFFDPARPSPTVLPLNDGDRPA